MHARKGVGLLVRWSLILTLCFTSLVAHASTGKGEPACQVAYVVARGDTLYDIARKSGSSVDAIKRRNHLRTDVLRVNQTLNIPRCELPHSGLQAEGAASDKGMMNLRHVVRRGDTLSKIAKLYGMTTGSIKRRNRLRRDFLRVGKRLDVRTRMGSAGSHTYVYTIRPGDTLGRIGKRFDIKVRDIRRMNGERGHDRLRIGDRIRLLIEGNPSRSEARGRPMAGKLVHGEQLKSGPGYHRRRPFRAWGTNETITQIITAVASVRRRYPRVHDLAIGDISAKHGGPINPHISHQTGRDVDLGYYFTKQPKSGPKGFISAMHERLDFAATWKLITSLVGRKKRGSPVQYIFMNYAVQERIYGWARRQGISKHTLDWMFQYPHGRRSMTGIIRHSKGHASHMHVRFRCPASDKRCRS